MKLIHRQRHDRRGRAPRIAFSQEEITADLNYPSSLRRPGKPAARGRRASER